MNLLEDWKSCLDETDLEIASTTKLHAMKRWFVAGAVVRRTMWGLLATISLVAWIYILAERVQLFSQRQLKTAVSTNTETVCAEFLFLSRHIHCLSPAHFPTVTCLSRR